MNILETLKPSEQTRRTTVKNRVRDAAGNIYHLMMNGSLRRTWAKPWHGKSQRRRVLANRRADRALRAANLQSVQS